MRDAGTRPVASRPGIAALIRLAVVAGMLATVGGGVWLVGTIAAPAAGPTTTDIPALDIEPADVEPGSAAPPADPVPGAEARGEPRQENVTSLGEWADRTAATVDVPARALLAYGNAELAMRATDPGCRLSWATLAGIGRIESDHGRYRGAVLDDDGRPSVPIVGVPLDGSAGVRAIPDTDGGTLDGDPVYDRAVGPMQFIPGTWARWGSDATGDGVADPHQIDDAALSAARYLCAGDRDMATPEGWWAGILSYNRSIEYARKVFGLADDYARQVHGGSD